MPRPGSGTSKPTIKGTRGSDDIAVVAQGVAVNGNLRAFSDAQINAGFILQGDAGDDSITGGRGPDEIDGGSGNDRISGGDGYDKLLGGGGDDTLIDAYNGATFDGGRGIDTLDFGGSLTAVAVDLSGTIIEDFSVFRGGNGFLYADLKADIPGNHVNGVIKGVEQITGSAYNDFLVGNYLANLIRGGEGDDYIAPGDINTVDDQFFGEGGNDVFFAGSGDDEFTGGTGSDTFVFWPNNTTGNYIIHDYTPGEDTVMLQQYNNGVSWTNVDYLGTPSLQASFAGDTITFVGMIDAAQIAMIEMAGVYGGP